MKKIKRHGVEVDMTEYISNIISPNSSAPVSAVLASALLVFLVLPFPLLGALAHLVSFAPVVFLRLIFVVSDNHLNSGFNEALYISKESLTIPGVCFFSPNV